MTHGFDASPEQLAANSRYLDGVAAVIKEIVDRHNDALAAIGEPWGKDKLGNQFAESYKPMATELGEYVAAVNTGVVQSVDQIVKTAATLHLTETGNVEVTGVRE